VVSNPEFLREGSAVKDFLNPDRIVVGASKPEAAERVAALFARLGARTVLTDAPSAEMIKYAANCFLAMKLSNVNALAELCERQGSLAKRRLALFGLTFKAGTDDLRDSPSLAVASLLRQAGAELTAYDPGLPAVGLGPDAPTVSVADDPYGAAKDVDAIVILT